MNNRIAKLLNTRSMQNNLKKIRRKRNNNGLMWASIVTLGAGLAAYGFGKKNNSSMFRPVQQAVKNIQPQTNAQMPNAAALRAAALAEFSEELGLDKNSPANK